MANIFLLRSPQTIYSVENYNSFCITKQDLGMENDPFDFFSRTISIFWWWILYGTLELRVQEIAKYSTKLKSLLNRCLKAPSFCLILSFPNT